MSERIPPDTKQEVIEAILGHIDDGASLRAACVKIDFPRKTFERWLESDPELCAQYERARANRSDKIFEEMLMIADTPLIGKIETTKEWGVEEKTADMIEHRRLQVETRKWMLGKMAPKKYGDRVELEHSGEVRGGSHPDLSKLSDEQLEQYIAMQTLLEGRESA